MYRLALAFCTVLVCCQFASAQLLTGSPTFTFGPTSQVGTISSNTLVITPGPNGFVVSGQLGITMPATTTPISGILAAWEVDYPINPAYGTNPALVTSTVLDGFVSPPPGLFSNTGGAITSSIVTLPGTAWPGSSSVIQTSLVNGSDSPLWTPAITVNTAPYAFTSAGSMVMRQRFTLDGIYNSGPGGTWLVDVPVTTTITPIPEPSVFAMLGIAVAIGAWQILRYKPAMKVIKE